MRMVLFAGLAVLGAAAVSFAFGSNSSGGGVHECACGPGCQCGDDCQCGIKR